MKGKGKREKGKVYCPYCGKAQSNAIETELQIFPNKRNRIVCEHCGREFWGYVYVNYEYRTEKKGD